VLSGGGALLKNLDYVVRQATGLPVFVAEDPLLCVVNGCGKVLENTKMFRATLFRQD
jgi:rod shape-determining protein MreB